MKKIVNIFGILALGFALSGCATEVELDGGDNTIAPVEGEPAQIEMTIETPATFQDARTRATFDTGFENGITNVAVVVANEEEDIFMVSEVLTASKLTQETSTTTFTLDVTPSESAVKLLVLANLSTTGYNTLTGSQFLAELQTKTEDELRDMFSAAIAETVQGITPVMPMFGEVTLSELNADTDIPTIHLTRGVARADVSLNLDGESGTFVPTSVQIFRANENIQFMPDRSAISYSSGSPKVTAPSVLGGVADPLANPYSATIEDPMPTGGVFATAYVSEALAATTPAERLAATCIVVGGKYNGSDDVTYYRTDFNPDPALYSGHPFGQIMRNWHYIFNITRVTGPGRNTPEEAATSDYTAIRVSITPWEDNNEDVNFGMTDFIKITDDWVELKSSKGSTGTTTIISTKPFTLVPNVTTAFSLLFDYSVAPLSPNDSYSQVVTFTAKNDVTPTSSGSGGGRIDVKIDGNDTPISIVVEQHPPTFVAGKTIDVLTIGDSEFSMSTADSYVRQMFESPTYFPADKPFAIAGFNFPNATEDLFTNETNALALAERLKDIEILYVPYGVDPAATNSDVIVEWLDADISHVLFMACETGGGLAEGLVAPPTNVTLRTKVGTYTGYNLQWKGLGGAVSGLLNSIEEAIPGDILNILQDIRGTFPSTGTGDPKFFDQGTAVYSGIQGGYGSSIFECTDGMAGIVSGTLPAGVTPLVYSYRSLGIDITYIPPFIKAKDPTRTDEMMLGVDVANRVVYVGESELFAGVDTSGRGATLDVVLLNLWGWAAKMASME
jgi:hypothetical protein